MRVGIVAAAVALVVMAGVLGALAGPGSAATGSGIARQSRTSGVAVAGGDVFFGSQQPSVRRGGSCTLAFAARSSATHRLGSLTAGHCVGTLSGGPAYTVQQTRGGAGDATYPGVGLGTVSRRDTRLGAPGDSALISLARGRSVRAAVFIGGVDSTRTMPVVGVAPLRDGVALCYSGEASGEHCGFRVEGRPRTIAFGERGDIFEIHHEWRATRATCPSRAGDSGSPVYVRSHGAAYAVGILSADQQHRGTCSIDFTPVRLALRQLNVSLAVS